MSAYATTQRQGKANIVLGVAAIALGLGLQAVSVYSAASQGPIFLANSSSLGRAAVLGEVSWTLILSGIVVAVVGLIRYAQSGAEFTAEVAPAMPAPAPAQAASVQTPAFCSSCGAAIAGAGRFCSACGNSTAR